MEKSKFKRLIKGMVFEMLEGKGDAPGATKKTSLATPGSVSKGGFSLQDFNSVLSGVAGERSGRSGSRSSKRASKWTLFKGGRNIDTWRLAVLQGGAKIDKKYRTAQKPDQTPQTPYMRSRAKSKTVTSNISSLAAVRKTDNDFQKLGGGRKTRVEGGQMKVSSAYIAQKGKAIDTYTKMIETEQSRIKKQIEDISNAGGAGTIEFVALMNLNEDINLRVEEYMARWDFAVAAYNGDQSAMNAARSNIEGIVDKRKHRQRDVGSGHYSDVSPWQPESRYKFGDKVTGKSGRTFLAVAGKWPEEELGMQDPEKGFPGWQVQK